MSLPQAARGVDGRARDGGGARGPGSPPRRVGRYELRRELGRGAQATVWLAKDPWQSGDNQRTLGGAGLGLRCNLGNAWSARADAAWRTLGGRPQASSGDTPQVWASLGYAF